MSPIFSPLITDDDAAIDISPYAGIACRLLLIIFMPQYRRFRLHFRARLIACRSFIFSYFIIISPSHIFFFLMPFIDFHAAAIFFHADA